MKILMITSSPHENGSSNFLAREFRRGAEEAGHKIGVFDAGHANVHPCLACNFCRKQEGVCVQDDDAMSVAQKGLLAADMAVFVTPLYYFGMSAQLKLVLDRCYAFNEALSAKHLKTALIVAAWDDKDWTMKALTTHYETLCHYLHFEDKGRILGRGCGTPEQTKASKFPALAYELGKSL